MQLLKDWRIIVLLCITLGLAPYSPEPHIVGKIRWIAGGAKGMQLQDYFDVVLHGFPFVLLVIYLIRLMKPHQENPNDQSS
jgi:hypothetical protein